MQTELNRTVLNRESQTSETPGVVYRIVCQNPGCGATFDLRITPENASLLSGTIACPRCRRHGGMLKPQGRLGNKLFAAKLLFRVANTAESRAEDEESSSEPGLRY
jgi:hypothetical protein